jgi:hypothetical protein
MTIGNIKHQVKITVESNNPQSRAVGILKLADVFATAGIHLGTDLNTETARLLSTAEGEGVRNILNEQIMATVVESTAKAPIIGHRPDGSTVVYRGMPGRETTGLYPVPYQRPGEAADRHAAEPGVLEGRKQDSLSGEQLSSDDVSPEAAAALSLGNIPGYEHNPMARAEHFEEVPGPIPASFVTTEHERSVQSNWPNPAPLGLVKYTGVVATDNYGESEPNYEYKIVGLGGHTGRSTLKEISLLTQVDKEVGPNGVRIEDLLAICSDHLSSLAACDQANQSQIDANKSIIKALHHLHGLTSLKHINPTGTLN